MGIPKKIFFYWSEKTIPEEILKNVENYKLLNPDFDVQIVGDDSEILINAFKKFPELYKIYKKIRIPACKSDVVRIVLLRHYGGIYIDCATTLTKSLEELYDTLKNKDIVISFNVKSYDYSTRILMCKKFSGYMKSVLDVVISNLTELYAKETCSQQHIDYNILMLTGTGPFYKTFNRLDYLPDIKSINADNNKLIGYLDDESPYFKHYNCCLNHHHNANFHLHWSERQKVEKLFLVDEEMEKVME